MKSNSLLKSNQAPQRGFLPVNEAEMKALGWDAPDFVLVTGDAYVDHPSFGAALIGRWLEHHGFRIALLAQPPWNNPMPFKEFGKPKLGFLITGGNLDSMLSNYTASKKPRRQDAYSPAGIGGKRPDRAVIVYANRCREAYKGVPVILGGIEASLRRFVHYDYWDNSLRRSVLLDSKADLLIYGMAEIAVLEAAQSLRDGIPVREIRNIRGTVFPAGIKDYDTWRSEYSGPVIEIPSYEDCRTDPENFARAHLIADKEQNPYTGKPVIQKHADRFIIANPPSLPLNQKQMDEVYGLPFVRTWHPVYNAAGGVPAIQEVEFSITSHRGCYGQCSFCALTFHQGKIIQSRSADSMEAEARIFLKRPDFKGYIHDVGGPTANFRISACEKMDRKGACPDKACMTSGKDGGVCEKLSPDHSDYLGVLRRLRSIPGIKKVFIRSGIRYDYILEDKKSGQTFLNELTEHHVSGQLKVAPEHISETVLKYMGKPGKEVYEEFRRRFEKANERAGKKQFLVPYLMSSHPGATLKEAAELALYIKKQGVMPEQVQDFIPTPGSLSTAMYYTERDLISKESVKEGLRPGGSFRKIHAAKSPEEKNMQRALLQFQKPENRALAEKALRQAGREDLIPAFFGRSSGNPSIRKNSGKRN